MRADSLQAAGWSSRTGMEAYFAVFLGAGLGGALRHAVNMAVTKVGLAFPAATLAVNVIGSLAMGLAAGYFLHRTGIDQHLRLFLTTGVLGGFTTFSAFSLDAVLMYQRAQYGLLASYVTASVLLSVGAVALGLIFVRTGIQN